MEDSDSRTAIKNAALDLLVRHGYRGMSFGDIAAELGITRANIHYHFGSKAALIDEVLADYVEVTLAALRSVWGSDDIGFSDKIERMIGYSRQRYSRYNDARHPVQPWSLISRLRQDEQLLSAAGRERLRHFTAELHDIFRSALDNARATRKKGVSPDALALLLVAIADNAAPITMAEGGFADLEATYRALLEVWRA